ncbi:uncharacterized protein LOC143920692 [Arctopsyche grandis]|uniref:uncharacterized protein LOC143920692 n=1 Tax=Arctopsyche grandis TaxID=121162 RepID=UPI00406DA47A
MGSSESKGEDRPKAEQKQTNEPPTTSPTEPSEKLEEVRIEYYRLKLRIIDLQNGISDEVSHEKRLKIDFENTKKERSKELAQIQNKIKTAYADFERQNATLSSEIAMKLKDREELNKAHQSLKAIFYAEETQAQKRFEEWRLIQLTNENNRKQAEETMKNLNQQIALAEFYLEKRKFEMNRLPSKSAATASNFNKISPEQKILQGQKPRSLVQNLVKEDVDCKGKVPELHLLICDKLSKEFATVRNRFMMTTQKHFEVLVVKKIVNHHTRANYLLRKKECMIMHGKDNVEEEMLFRGVRADEIERICKHNFHWENNFNYVEKNFSKGLSFTPVSNQANRNCDQQDHKVIVLATILKCKISAEDTNSCTLFCSHELKLDRVKKQRPKRLCIKYRSDEFYPNYLIYFRGTTIVQKT